MQKKVVNLLWDDARLTIVPATRRMETLLRIKEKKIVKEEVEGQRYSVSKTKQQTVDLFQVISEDKGGRIIETYQGFVDLVADWCRENGFEVIIHDRRQEFPMPRLDLMHGFRFSQKELLTLALLQNRSGLIGAPTRYGKTTLLINTIRAYPGLPTVVTVPGELLVQQLYADVAEAFPHRKVSMLGAGSKCKYPSDDITVCSMDSLDKCDHGFTRLVLVDESHAAVTDSRLPEILKFVNARKIGFGATLSGRFDGRDKMIIGALGPVLREKTYLQAVAEGAIAPLMVYFCKIPVQPPPYTKRLYAYRHMLYRNPGMIKLCAKIRRELFPPHWQGIIFIKEEPQADLIKEAIPEGTVAMAKKLKVSERKELMRAMVADEVKCAIASDILSQGVTFNFVRWLINMASGGPYTGSIQKPGRLAEIRPDIPDKRYGIIIDFQFESADELNPWPKGEWAGLIYESISRKKAYMEKGYEVVDVDSFEALKAHFDRTHIQPYQK